MVRSDEVALYAVETKSESIILDSPISSARNTPGKGRDGGRRRGTAAYDMVWVGVINTQRGRDGQFGFASFNFWPMLLTTRIRKDSGDVEGDVRREAFGLTVELDGRFPLHVGCGACEKIWKLGDVAIGTCLHLVFGPSESQPNKVRTRLFDLECPSEEYINKEDGARGVSAKNSYKVSSERNGNLSMHYDSNYSSNGEATSFGLKLLRTRGFTDLNEPIPVEEPSSSACVGFNQRGVEVLQDLEVESRQNGGEFSNKFENEIPENSNGVSTVTSHGLDPMSVHSWSDAAHSEILSVSSRAIFNGNLSQNGSRTYGQLNTTSTALLQDHDIIRGKLLVDSNSRSLPSSLPWMMGEKSTIDLNAGTMAADGYEIEEISRSDFASVNGSINQNSNGELSWLRAPRPSYVKPNKDVEVLMIQSIRKVILVILQAVQSFLVSLFLKIYAKIRLRTPLKPSSHASAIDGVNSDTTRGPLSAADTSSDNPNANAGRIDLNLCAAEKGIEDTQLTSFSVRTTNVRIARIDLEMPVNTEMGTRDTLDYKSVENNPTKPSNLLHGEVEQSPGLTSVSVALAAEALIVISSSCVIDLRQNAGSDKSEVSASDSLLWFAEIVTTCRSDTENDVGSIRSRDA
ncbi:hypothetical protein F3Y22_tig00110548pilonHSYRG00060 [Hibiscus syriacus]|uniref:Uncharacterized protein n=1 Tax=Hibiscus syriacus TaxID=106335 RepID=A0A6A3A9B4_HIBSY|nr:hypothetical protein F3Y22_tig00110548pilonHSYRG00060 [Hibiscus syriacus]